MNINKSNQIILAEVLKKLSVCLFVVLIVLIIGLMTGCDR